MKTTTVGKIQKNFARVLKEIKAGEEIIQSHETFDGAVQSRQECRNIRG
jgi:hypothetical protein